MRIEVVAFPVCRILFFLFAIWVLPIAFIRPAHAECSPAAVEEKILKAEFQEALDLAGRCFKDMDYPRLKGLAFHGLYNADSAVFYLRTAYRDGRRGDEVLLGLSEALLWGRNFGEAAPLLKAVADKKSLPYLKAVATEHEMQGRLDRALEIYDKIIPMEGTREKPAFAAMRRRAQLLSWLKRFRESLRQYAELVEAKGAPPAFRLDCRVERAEVLAWSKDLPGSLSELDGVLRQNPSHIGAHLKKGEVLEWMGEFRKAKDIYRDALILDSENRTAKSKLENLLWVK